MSNEVPDYEMHRAEAVAAAEALVAACRKFSAQVKAEMDAAGVTPTIKCKDCGTPRDLDEHETQVAFRSGRRVAVYRDCGECRARRWLGEVVGVPARLLHARLDNFEAENNHDADVLRRCVQFAPRMSQGIVVIASPVSGCGKSHLAVGMLRRHRESRPGQKWKAVFIRTSQFAEELAASYDGGRSPVRRMNEAGLLVWDDFGCGKITDDMAAKTEAIFERRCDDGAPTIVTTNLTSDQFKTHFGPRAVDRIRAELLAWLPVTGAGRRPRLAATK